MKHLPLPVPGKAVTDKWILCEDIAEWFEHHNQTTTARGYVPYWWREIMKEVEESQ